MKRLYILRHAKSSWAQPGLSDIERPLNKRGRRQVEALAGWFADRDDALQMVLCSPSVRTRETWDGIREPFGEVGTEFPDELYAGSNASYLDAIAGRGEDSIMIIGHNPTCDELARYLTAPSSPEAQSLMGAHFGTANLAVFDLEIDEWDAISRSSGNLVVMLRPRDLISVR